MARYAYNNTTVDQNGKILGGATVSLYLAGTTTPAKMYAASAGGTAVYSMLSSNVNGSFTFYVDDGDYAIGQLFDITTTKTNYVPVTFSSVHIYNPTSTITIDTDVTLAADSNLVVASQHATKTYVDTGLAGKISHSLATAANDFLVASGPGVFVKNTLAQVKALLAGASAGDLIAWASGPKYPAGDGSLLTARYGESTAEIMLRYCGPARSRARRIGHETPGRLRARGLPAMTRRSDWLLVAGIVALWAVVVRLCGGRG